MHHGAGVERAAGLRGQVAREPGQGLTAAAISVVIFAVDDLVALSAPSPSLFDQIARTLRLSSDLHRPRTSLQIPVLR